MLNRRVFISAVASAVAVTGAPAFSAEEKLTIGLGGAGPSRFHPSFVKDVGLLTDLNNTNQGAPYWNLDTYITPVSEFYIRNAFPTPRPELDSRVDPRFWKLQIHGDAVEREMTITYEDLLKMPSRSMMSVMQCTGNGRTLFWEQEDMLSDPTKVTGNGWGLGGVGMGEWEFVPMSYILDLVGLKPNAKACLFWSGVDGKAPNTASDTGRPIPASELHDRPNEIGLAFKLNGMPLPADHGAPVRAFVPGWCGGASTKWLTEIKIASHDFWVRLNTTDHTLIGPDYPPPVAAANDEFRFIRPDQLLGQPVTWQMARSMLVVPLTLRNSPDLPANYPLARGEKPVMKAGPQTLRGYAWAPNAGVRQVDVRVNGGSWQSTRLIDVQPNRYSWTRFEFAFNPGPGDYVIETRATDRKGIPQPATVPYNKGGYNFFAIPKFDMRFT